MAAAYAKTTITVGTHAHVYVGVDVSEDECGHLRLRLKGSSVEWMTWNAEEVVVVAGDVNMDESVGGGEGGYEDGCGCDVGPCSIPVDSGQEGVVVVLRDILRINQIK